LKKEAKLAGVQRRGDLDGSRDPRKFRSQRPICRLADLFKYTARDT